MKYHLIRTFISNDGSRFELFGDFDKATRVNRVIKYQLEDDLWRIVDGNVDISEFANPDTEPMAQFSRKPLNDTETIIRFLNKD